jgi:hypothetical protein
MGDPKLTAPPDQHLNRKGSGRRCPERTEATPRKGAAPSPSKQKPSRSKQNALTSSVLFVLIGTFQWVTRNPNKKIRSCLKTVQSVSDALRAKCLKRFSLSILPRWALRQARVDPAMGKIAFISDCRNKLSSIPEFTSRLDPFGVSAWGVRSPLCPADRPAPCELPCLSAFQRRRATQSAIGRLAVTPGDSIPNRLINPATP